MVSPLVNANLRVCLSVAVKEATQPLTRASAALQSTHSNGATCLCVPYFVREGLLRRELSEGTSGQAPIKQIGTFSATPEDIRIKGPGIWIQLWTSRLPAGSVAGLSPLSLSRILSAGLPLCLSISESQLCLRSLPSLNARAHVCTHTETYIHATGTTSCRGGRLPAYGSWSHFLLNPTSSGSWT